MKPATVKIKKIPSRFKHQVPKYKIIRSDTCISCGTCWNSCPDFFEKSPEDFCGQVIEKYRIKNNPFEGEAPAGIGKMVKRAADLCPVRIIQIS